MPNASGESVMQLSVQQPVWRRFVGALGPIVQCAAALVIVRKVADHGEAPYIVPYLLIMLGFGLFDGLVRKNHPSVIVELTRTDVPLADRLTFVGGGVLLAIHFVVAIADAAHYHWTGPVAPAVQVLGLVVMFAGFLFATWAMLLNPFFSPIVRVQRERRHHVVTDGPYSVVRHPAYFGISIGSVASAFALGSYWSLVPVLLFILAYARRAWVEDRKLSAELDGFAQYAQRVRYRLIPLVW